VGRKSPLRPAVETRQVPYNLVVPTSDGGDKEAEDAARRFRKWLYVRTNHRTLGRMPRHAAQRAPWGSSRRIRGAREVVKFVKGRTMRRGASASRSPEISAVPDVFGMYINAREHRW
jgi:hypothetical protein